MKPALSLVLLATVFSIAAHAKVEIKTPSAPKSDAKDLATCPHLTQVQIVTKGISLKATSLTIKTGTERVPFDPIATSKECLSDMVCDTFDNFEILKAGFASVRRNNDGNYPTRDLPGHNLLVLSGNTLSGKFITCRYDLVK